MIETISTWDELLDPNAPDMPEDVARFFVGLRMRPSLSDRFQDLADKNSAGTLSESERSEMWNLATSNQLMSILKSRARLSLKRKGISLDTPK